MVTEVVATVSSDSSGQIHVLLLNSNAFGMDCAQIGVLEKTDDVGLASLLQSMQCLRLEAQAVVHLSANRTHETLKGSARQKHIS